MFLRILLVLSCFGVSSACFSKDFRPQPEISTHRQEIVKFAVSSKDMVVTAHPEATKAARNILNLGGNAVDATVAAQAVLGLVEPQSSGLGGGGFLLYYRPSKKGTNEELLMLDARETAPLAMPSDAFIHDDETVMGFYEAAHSGRSVGIPAMPMLMYEAQNVLGKISPENNSVLYKHATELASQGFSASPRLIGMVENAYKNFPKFPETDVYFSQVLDGGIVKNASYVKTLKDISIGNFYNENRVQRISDKVQSYGGYMQVEDMLVSKDLRKYRHILKQRYPLCEFYRGYKVCSMNEPSSGGLTILQTLKMLERFDLSAGPTAQNLHRIIEASRLAFADRGQYMADNDFVSTPNVLLLDHDYIQERSGLISENRALKEVSYGRPDGWKNVQASDMSEEKPGTTHISIIDQWGNVASMTSSIESAFGSHIMVDGFLLNNQLTDFSFLPEENGKLIANRVEGGKRPRSSMSPTIVFDPDGDPFMVIGSAGGSRIIGYVLQRLIAVIDWDMAIEGAVSMPHIVSRGGAVDVETENDYPIDKLKALGHRVVTRKLNSGMTAIHVEDGKYIGVADPRREGSAR